MEFVNISEYTGKGVGRHQHPNCEIVYYLQGTGVLRVGDKCHHFRPGDAAILPADVPHSEEAEFESFSNLFMGVYQMENGRDFVVCHDTVSGDLKSLLLQMLHLYRLRSKNWKLIENKLLEAYLAFVSSFDMVKPKSPGVELLEQQIIENLANQHFDLSAAILGITSSDKYFRMQFKEQTGKAPLQYLTNKRIQLAKDLLLHPNINVSEVAFHCGFNDPYYFSRVFKNTTGKSPLAWKKAKQSAKKQ